MVGGIDTDCESVHRLARPRKLVELPHELRHPLPHLRCLRLRDAGVPDETPQFSVQVRGGRLPSCHLEIVEVSRQILAVTASLDPDVEHPCRTAVEPLVDR